MQQLQTMRQIFVAQDFRGREQFHRVQPKLRILAAALRPTSRPLAQQPRPNADDRLDPDLHVSRVVDGVNLSNGLDWSLDGRQMYYIDSPTYGVDVFDFEPNDGSLSARRRLITIAAGEGLPDGMTVDAEGGLWIALHGSGSIRRYTPDGRVDRVVHVPPPMVTCFPVLPMTVPPGIQYLLIFCRMDLPQPAKIFFVLIIRHTSYSPLCV